MLRFLKPILGATDYYVSDEGEIFSKKTGNLNQMKTKINHLGFDSVTLRIEKNGKFIPSHRHVNDLVAKAWLPNGENNTKTKHIDGNKRNNHVSNLEWIKSVVRTKKPQKSVLSKAIVQATLEGKFVAEYASMTEAHKATGISVAKISAVCREKQIKTGGFLWFYKEKFVEGKGPRKNVQCKKVRQYTKKGVFVAEYESVKEAADSVGTNSNNISHVCLGKGKTCKGYIWRFAEKIEKEDKNKDHIILENYPKDYITNDGQIISILTKKNKVQVFKQGQKAVRIIDKDNVKTTIHVHLLIALAYVPNPNSYEHVKHIDGNYLNNNFKNLEWCEKDPLIDFEVPSDEDLQLIPGTENYYASKYGEIFSTKSGKLFKMKFQEDPTGYWTLILRIEQDGVIGPVSCLVHRLIALAWIENPNELPKVNHIDENKKNNCVTNLEWITSKGNYEHSKDSYKHYQKAVVQATLDGKFVNEFESMKKAEDETGISARSICLVCQGKRRKAGEFTWFYKKDFVEGKGMRKLKQCKKVRQYTKKGKFMKEFESVQDAAKAVGALASNISNACNGRQETCRNYIWKFVEEEEKPDETEDWVVLDEYPHDKISRDGRIFSTWVKRLKKLKIDGKEYRHVSITDIDGVEHKMFVHMLIAKAYIPNPRGLKFANHIDGDPSNNTVENLEWSNHNLNAQHAYDNGLNSSRKKVRQLEDGVVVGRFDSMAEAAEAVGVSASAISHCCCGDTGLKTAGGYSWEYDTD